MYSFILFVGINTKVVHPNHKSFLPYRIYAVLSLSLKNKKQSKFQLETKPEKKEYTYKQNRLVLHNDMFDAKDKYGTLILAKSKKDNKKIGTLLVQKLGKQTKATTTTKSLEP